MKKNFTLFLEFLIILTGIIYLKQDIICEYLKELYIPFTPKPTISILLSSYNMGKHLPKAIDSIINQTYQDWELIVINDGSEDITVKNLRKYRWNPKIRTITNKKNIGLIPSLHKGYKKVRGDFLSRHDADDYSYPNKLERLITIMEKENLDMAGAWCSEKDYFLNSTSEDNLNTISIGLFLMKENTYCQTATIYRKSFLDKHNIKYNPEYLNAEDYDFYMQVFLNGGKMAYLGGEPLAHYHRTYHSKKWFKTQSNSARNVQKRAFSQLIPNYNEEMLEKPLSELMPYIIEGNKTTKILDQKELEKCNETKCYELQKSLH